MHKIAELDFASYMYNCYLHWLSKSGRRENAREERLQTDNINEGT